MSIHKKVCNTLITARSRLVQLRSETGLVDNVDILSEMIKDLERMVSIADETLLVHQSQREKVGQRDSFGLGNLGVGEFVEVPAERVASLRVCASRMNKNGGGKYTVKAQPNGVFRCTRLALGDGDTF